MKKKKKILQYTVYFLPEDDGDGFTVEVPALPGCVSYGKTVSQAKKNIQEAIELYLEVLAERGYKAPADDDPNFFKGKIVVSFHPRFA